MNRRLFIKVLTFSGAVIIGCRKKQEITMQETPSIKLLFPFSNDFFIANCLNPITINNPEKKLLTAYLKQGETIISETEIVDKAHINVPEFEKDTLLNLTIGNNSYNIPIKVVSGKAVTLSNYTSKLENGEIIEIINTTNKPFFFKKNNQIFKAYSLVCTHNGCTAQVAADKRINCLCHGSVFDENGNVLNGPALINLQEFAVTHFTKNNIIVVNNL